MDIRANGFSICLKTLCLEDACDIAKHANDPDIARNVAHIGDFPLPYTEECALSFIASALEMECTGYCAHFGITLGGTTIGACALLNIDKELHRCELGYWIGKEYWGKGYASEALRLLLKFAFESIRIKEITACTFRANARSTKLLNALRFSISGTQSGAQSKSEVTYSLSNCRYADPIEIVISKQ